MLQIAHRVNTLKELGALSVECGAEIDLRDRGDRLVLQHDPFADGEDFESWLAGYHHRTLVLNVKSERIEGRIRELLGRHSISDYFFLDCSVPMIFRLSEDGERNLAVRYSEIEPLEAVIALKDRVSWVWIDCFTRLPELERSLPRIHELGLKSCLVSPELQGRKENIEEYRDALRSKGLSVSAVCTKCDNIALWK